MTVACKNCNGQQVYHFRLDSDWASGAGDFTALNKGLPEVDRPDIECDVCMTCGVTETFRLGSL